jgi:membrane protein implicated in regulation of membrane protease activity
VRRFISFNSLSIFFLVILLATLTAQAIAGHDKFNEEATAHKESEISLGRYVTSSSFGQAVMENWQSEFLQFSLYVLATVYLIQRGSPESKKPGLEGTESDEDQLVGQHAEPNSPKWARAGGWRQAIYSNSLLLLMGSIFIGTWFAQSACGWSVFNQDQITHHESTVSYLSYLGKSDFWEASLQNWQSEFLAIGSMAIFSVYLRQRGSPESKPVGAPHYETASSG